MSRSSTFSHLFAFIFIALVGNVSAAIGPVTDLNIVNADIAPDGFSRATVLAEGQFPGPVLIGNKGDRFEVNVINHLTNATMLSATSIHWHGVFQRGTNWADGAAFVNQCPIVSGNHFLYNFTGFDQAGTFWYHSHLSTQYCDGLRGPMIIYDPDDPHKDLYDIDDESTIITLANWYHIAATLQTGIPKPDSTLINGRGRWFGNPTSNLAVIKVTSGKRYRFRLINTSCDANYKFSVDAHVMTVIEADGQNTLPLTVDQMQIFAGQRYSFVLEANQPVGNYWMRAQPNIMKNDAIGFDNGINSAILRYEGAFEHWPDTIQAPEITNPLVESSLNALENPAAPGDPVVGGVDRAVDLALDFDRSAHNFTVNGFSFTSPDVPVLLQILSGTQNAQDLLPRGSVFSLPRNATVEISLSGLSIGGPHPFHLHGHAFSVVQGAGQTSPNYINPVRRDTFNTGMDGDNVTIRFRTDSPGPWLFHCHVDWHVPSGLAVVFAEDISETAAMNPVPQAWSDLCPEYNESIGN